MIRARPDSVTILSPNARLSSRDRFGLAGKRTGEPNNFAQDEFRTRSVGLQEVDGPGLDIVEADEEDSVLAVHLAGDDDGGGGVGVAGRVACVRCSHPDGGPRIEAVVGAVLRAEVDGDVTV